MRPVGERVPLADEYAKDAGTDRARELADRLADERDSAKCAVLWDALLAEADGDYAAGSLA